MNSQIKVGQKVWVDNLEKNRVEKWIVKAVTVNSVTVENKKSKGTLQFFEKGGRMVLINEETNRISSVLYRKRRSAKITLRKRCGISDLDIVLYIFLIYSFLDLRNGNPIFIEKNKIWMPVLVVICVRHIYISIMGYLSRWEDKIFLLISIIGRLILAIKGDASDEYMWNYMMGQMLIMLLWLMLKGYRWIQWVSSEQEKKNDV